ncbi:MAG: Flp pilus assembly protein CpaB [Myxococcales bacterium]|jgi:pilus assembly protein CpaB
MTERTSPDRKALWVSAMVALVGCLLLGLYMRQFQREARGGELIPLLAMRKDVNARQPLDEGSLLVRMLPESYVGERHIRASELPQVLGVRAAGELKANQWLLWTDLSMTRRESGSLSSRVPKGMRAILVEQTPRGALTALLAPGDRVDVLLTKAKFDQGGSVVTVPLLQNVLVLAVGNSARPAREISKRAADSSVILLLTMEQASLLAQARRGGELSLILRNADDLEIAEGVAETDDSDVLELEERERRQRRARIERVD